MRDPIYLPEAEEDLGAIYDWIADGADPVTAFNYITRMQVACRSLLDFPSRGTPHDDLAPGLRSVAFERRATIYYRPIDDRVEIVRVIHRGRDALRAIDPA